MANLGENIKKLGFGLMRLPKTDGVIDVEQVKEMVDKFLAAGFTYFDTAWIYNGSEDAIRQALVERHPRSSYLLATKLAAWAGDKTRQEAVAQFETSLRRTGAGYFDFYLLHNLGGERTKVFEELGLWEFALEKKQQGLIKHLGFSFHSTAQELDEILTKHPEAEFVQLQINYADWDSESIQSRLCYEVARKHGKEIVIMEPIKGGLLANPPDVVQNILKAQDPNASLASWAVRFAANLEGVITVLSGMSDLAQMEDNLSYMTHFTKLTPQEEKALAQARDAMNRIPLIPCTKCDYCAKVCPKGIGISGSFQVMNHYTLYRNMDAAQDQLRWRVAEKGLLSPSECIGCGACEEVCPQHIAIRQELETVAKTLY